MKMDDEPKDPLTEMAEKMIEDAAEAPETVTIRLQAVDSNTFTEPCDIEAAELIRENHPTSRIIFQVGKYGWVNYQLNCVGIKVWDKTVLVDEGSIDNLIKALKLAQALFFGVDKNGKG